MIVEIQALTLLSGMYLSIFTAMYFEEYHCDGSIKMPNTYVVGVIFTMLVFIYSLFFM